MENKTIETIEELVEVSVNEETTVAEANEPEYEVPQTTTEGNAKGGFLTWLAKKLGQTAGTIIVYELGKRGVKKLIYKGKNWAEARKQAKLAAKQATIDAENDVIIEAEELED